MIGVVASMQEELQFVDKCEFAGEEECGAFTFRKYKYKKTEIITGVCGTGKVGAAACAQLMSYKYPLKALVSMGTGGSLKDGMKINDIIISTDVIQYDFDCSAFGSYKKGELPELKTVEIKADGRLLSAAKQALSGNNVHFGRVLTADRIVVNEEEKKKIVSEFGGLCCEMEAGAVAQVALMNKIGFLAIKGISDGEKEEEARYGEFRSNIIPSSLNTGEAFLRISEEMQVR